MTIKGVDDQLERTFCPDARTSNVPRNRPLAGGMVCLSVCLAVSQSGITAAGRHCRLSGGQAAATVKRYIPQGHRDIPATLHQMLISD